MAWPALECKTGTKKWLRVKDVPDGSFTDMMVSRTDKNGGGQC